ncbi:hypothetical protein U4I65_02590 [Stenotrophomonas maltophilia]|uniref:hypothetical protein n=1 Tax=Stenotrophomonas maltophilia TaxID=40324 RepID=UPI002ACCD8E1|nr:hypothetical protein [Stenotrophomonas maltophilia]MDZ5813924.1 hypothetical protein [Stenotrophomonas maltophilia]
MTISADDRRKEYFGNGVARTFTGPRAFQDSHIQVLTGTEPPFEVVPSSEYVVSGMGGKQTSVTFNTAPADGISILIVRVVPLDQPTDITNQGAFLPEIHEDAFDYRVMQLQQTADGNIKLPVEVGGDVSPFLPTPQPLWALRWNGASNKIENYLPTEFAAPGGSNMIGWQNSGFGALILSVMAKLRQTVSPADYATFEQAVAAAAGRPFVAGDGSWGGQAFIPEIATGRIRILAGTLRQDAVDQSQWAWISDDLHVPVGMLTSPADVVATAANLVINFKENYKRIITFIVVPDEYLASQLGVSCGSSVNTNAAAINLSINKEVAGEVWYEGAGVWRHKMTSMGVANLEGPPPTWSAGNLQVDHEPVYGTNNPAMLTPWSIDGAVVPWDVSLKRAISPVSFVVNFPNAERTAFNTVADNQMAFTYRKSINAAVRLDNTGATAGLPLSNGNLWVLGIMEAN